MSGLKLLKYLEYIMAALKLRCILVILVILDHLFIFRVIIPDVVLIHLFS